ncbi:MAG: hypothetical protein KDE59_13235 [Anaerolineales bacterium]|nr:hypothetical protein [Anaerolineales bacterium]MCB0005905.1 hypothetical protein [Anaerolineales bacterium]MCB0012725.1 hypothetical protein [Anaerolineales bacterium]MCB0027830.1 hypothetical protein [Anaerolineales bacterium]MCB8962133.1 hypothetical protein [Ardenticatenales bacterium]
MSDEEMNTEVLSETENFIAWRHEDEDGVTYHLELGGLTLHISADEWDELVTLFKAIK